MNGIAAVTSRAALSITAVSSSFEERSDMITPSGDAAHFLKQDYKIFGLLAVNAGLVYFISRRRKDMHCILDPTRRFR